MASAVLDARHGAAGHGRGRVALGGDDDRHGIPGVDDEPADAVEPAGRRGQQEAAERRAQPGEGDLAVGVAEARVELDDAGAARGEGEADVEDADVGGAAVAHLADRRLGHPVHDELGEVGGHPVERGVGPHAAGVGAGVAVTHALEVLGGREREHGGAVGEAEDGGLGAVEVLLDDDAATGSGEAGGGVGAGRLEVVGDDDALAGGEAVLLDDVGRPEGVERVVDLLGGGADVRHGGGHPGGGHDLLGERLAALESGGGGRRDRRRRSPRRAARRRPRPRGGPPGRRRRGRRHTGSRARRRRRRRRGRPGVRSGR